MGNGVKGKIRKQKSLLINGRKIIVESLLSPNEEEILDVIVKFDNGSLSKCHLTYHKDDELVFTHVREENTTNRKHGRKFICNGTEDFVSTVWVSFLIGHEFSCTDLSDLAVVTKLPFCAFRFCITPTKKVIELNEKIYTGPGAADHNHSPISNFVENILTTRLNTLDIEILETCCPAVKRKPFGLGDFRDWSSVTQEFGIVNKDGVIDITLMTPTSIFEGG